MKSIRTALLAMSALALSFGAATAHDHDHGDRHRSDDGRFDAPRFDVLRPEEHHRDHYRSYAAPPFARDARRFGYPEASVYPAPARSFRRGQYVPHDYWSGEIADPRSRHLRSPPPGYGWIGVGRDAYLMQRSTGLILDSVPGAW